MTTTMKDKYVEMANTRDDYNSINPDNFLTPNMNEMVDEDLMMEIYEDYINNDPDLDLKDINKQRLDAAYYTESPFTTIPGYYEEEGVFVLKANSSNVSDMSYILNQFDGDTTYFPISELDDGGEEFSFIKGSQTLKYKGFKDYFKKMNGSSVLTVRHAGIDTAEIPHFGIQPILKTAKNNRIISVSFKELKEEYLVNPKYTVLYEKYPVDAQFNLIERKDTDIIKLLKVMDDGKNKKFVEIIERIKIQDNWIDNKSDNYDYYPVISTEESTRNTILDGYKAQNIIRNKLAKASDIILVLNAQGVSIDRSITTASRTFNSLYYTDDIVRFLIDEWNTYYKDLPQTNFGYQPYGTDAYGRSLGAVYIKDGSTGNWINLNKYVLANTEHTKANPQYNDSPELQQISSGMSDIFNLWSYNRDNIDWVDSFNKISSKSYEDRLELHKKLTGIDFLKIRDCALMIGDTLMLVPPTNIRNLNQVTHERIPVLRSKGTMAKQMDNVEHLLEISLYFYEEAGINGIPYVYTTPNGTTLEYKMDGLRSLIAQFKIAPFLPIENGYINDVLGVEAVALQNLSIQTVEGYPRLLKAILTLKEFNYRVFMPDLPIDDDMENTDENRLSMLQPMFAKSFNWDLFRYYYQRSLIAGQKLSLLEFASYDYNLMYYGNKNTIAPWIFCGPKSNKGEISFYIPDEEWLSNALQLKKQRDNTPLTNSAGVVLSKEAMTYMGKLKKLSDKISVIKDYSSNDPNAIKFRQCINDIFDIQNKKGGKIKLSIPVLEKNKTITNKAINTTNESMISITRKDNYAYLWSETRNTFINPLVDSLFEAINVDADLIKSIRLDEEISKNKLEDNYNVIWKFKIKLNLNSISDEDWTDIREVFAKELDIKVDEVFKDEEISLDYRMIFTHKMTNLWEVCNLQIINPDNITSNGYYNTFKPIESDDEKALQTATYDSTASNETELGNSSKNEQNVEIDFYVKDYKNPANMPFNPYIEGVLCKTMGASISNTFTDVNIKAIEGQGPQYLGGQDTVIEVELITDDITVVSALNTLPTLASAMAKKYRRILPAWPIKVKSDLTSMLGVSEVLIDTMQVDTVEGFPGVYSIAIRMTSVDRTQRQKEALRRLDVKPQGGKVDYNGNSNLSMKNYFSIDDELAKAELYPDLDLPTIEELSKLGFRFVKYSGKKRMYPDPDFYISYAYPYTSMIIKKLVKDVISQQVLSKEGKESLQTFKFKDVMGSELTAKVEAYTGLNIVSTDNDSARTYQDIVSSLEEQIAEKLKNNKRLTNKDIENIEDRLGLIAAIKKLVMSDINDGWEIRPGWKATLSEMNTEKAIKEYVIDNKENAYAKNIIDIRKKAISLIDKILSKPIKMRKYDGDTAVKETQYKKACQNVVNDIFVESKEGRELIELLCPGLKIDKAWSFLGADFGKSYFKNPDPLQYIVGYLFSAGCALTGQREYRDKAEKSDWYPNHYVNDITLPNKCRDKGNKYEGMYMPYCVVNRLEGSSKVTTKIEDAISNGTIFGGWKIIQYADAATITNMVESESTIPYTNNKSNSVFKTAVKPGFIDPYYNSFASNSNTIKEYKENILISKESNIEAFLRNALVFLRKMIIDGLLISEIDILASDFTKVQNEILRLGINEDGNYDYGLTQDSNSLKKVLQELGYDHNEMKEMMISINSSMKKNFCARLIYPFLLAATKGSDDLYQLLKDRNYNALNSLTGYIEDASNIADSKTTVLKFLSAMSGIDMSLNKDGRNEAFVSESQKLMNSLLKDVFIEASEDPRAYILHSFYDMLINDKRGRLVRAFPTYYVIFIDEGRKIGSWKLHDNFYNMSSISSINVVKSRKIAADTCSIVMNNMFNSYAQEPDATTTQQYADIYGLRDVYDSIFSPKTYFDKEKRLRLRQQLTDTVVLQPGIRIHVRIGYSADGSKLPIVFNGKVAEVSVGPVAEIVAQGDGHELMNPLNAFGQMEATDLDPAQSSVTWFKDIRGSWAKGGESPRDLLAKLLTARHGGWKKVVDYFFDGRWFNDNPFGITHFGDKKFDQIFEQGEVVQNLYEVSDNTLLKGVNDLTTEEMNKKVTPTINTSLEDKTFWDLLHLAANTGLNYIGAIRDFGFRSTIFLGKPNHYYAYAYEMVDNKIVERRKPFQQFHYYDSYTDIVYNSIKASEAQMKTNAVGIWQSSAMLWGREQSTVGPIYLDMNIYPEYQKSMTVDTQLLADGDGAIDLGIINHFTEEWNMSPNDNKVNKSTAWRVTANTLKQSVKDMYQGDLCVLGDPSVKPYDRIYLHDTYEDMKGMFEVEAVIHNMSIETGFTTSIMPDVIARHGDDFETSVQSLTSPIFATIGFTTGAIIIDKLWGAAVHNKLVTTIAKSDSLWRGASKINEIASDFANAPGFKDFLESKPGAKSFFDKLNVLPRQNNIDLNTIDKAIDALSEIKLNNTSSWDDIAKAIGHYSKIDISKYENALKSALEKDKYGYANDFANGKLEETLKKIKDTKAKLDENLNFDKLNLKDFADEIFKVTDGKLSLDKKIDLASQQILQKWAKGTIDKDTVLEDLARILKEPEILEAIKDNKLKTDTIDDFVKGFKNIFKNVDGSDVTLFKSLAKALKGDNLLDTFKVIAKGALKLNWATLLIDLAIDATITVVAKNTQEMFTRFLQSVQAIDVYPLKKNNKPLIAGMNGHKGSVYGYPVLEGYNSIQGMIIEFTESLRKMLGGNVTGLKWFADSIMDIFVDTDTLSSLAAEWRVDLGIDTKEEVNKEEMMQEVYGNISSMYAANNQYAYSLMTKPRISVTDKSSKALELYNFYRITGVNPLMISSNNKLLNLFYVLNDTDIRKAVIDGRFIISHSSKPTYIVAMPFESGTVDVPIKVKDSIIDIPLIQEEGMYIIRTLLNDSRIKENKTKIYFKSGTKINDTTAWRSTGFRFLLEVKGSINVVEEVLKELKNNTSIIKDSVGVFQYSINDKKIEIKINPPIQTIVEGAN